MNATYFLNIYIVIARQRLRENVGIECWEIQREQEFENILYH